MALKRLVQVQQDKDLKKIWDAYLKRQLLVRVFKFADKGGNGPDVWEMFMKPKQAEKQFLGKAGSAMQIIAFQQEKILRKLMSEGKAKDMGQREINKAIMGTSNWKKACKSAQKHLWDKFDGPVMKDFFTTKAYKEYANGK